LHQYTEYVQDLQRWVRRRTSRENKA